MSSSSSNIAASSLQDGFAALERNPKAWQSLCDMVNAMEPFVPTDLETTESETTTYAEDRVRSLNIYIPSVDSIERFWAGEWNQLPTYHNWRRAPPQTLRGHDVDDIIACDEMAYVDPLLFYKVIMPLIQVPAQHHAPTQYPAYEGSSSTFS
jgi:hypothetical protein